MLLPRVLVVVSVLLVAAGLAWIYAPLGLIGAGGMVWWDLHQGGRSR